MRCAPAPAHCGRAASRPRRWMPGSAWSTRSTTCACRLRWHASTAATTAWPHWRCAATASTATCAMRPRATARTASAWSWAPARRASCKASSRTASAPPTARCRRWLHYAETHDNASLARYVQAALQLQGPAWVISTACSSGAKAYAAAARLIALGVIDAAVVGGVDTLCMTTLYGFHSLELLSTEVCRPWDVRRNGLSLGEGGSFALLQRDDDDTGRLAARLRREQRRPPHEQPASRGRRRGRCDARGAGRRRIASRSSGLREPARHRHAQQRHRRGRGGVPGVRPHACR